MDIFIDHSRHFEPSLTFYLGGKGKMHNDQHRTNGMRHYIFSYVRGINSGAHSSKISSN